MTTSYDPSEHAHFARAGLGGERTRVFDACHGCRAAGEVAVVGDCHPANGAVTEEAGKVPMHPVQVRAHGIPEEG